MSKKILLGLCTLFFISCNPVAQETVAPGIEEPAVEFEEAPRELEFIEREIRSSEFIREETAACESVENDLTTRGEPSENFDYVSESYGFKVSLPYSPDWGSNEFSIARYEHVDDDSLKKTLYGPLFPVFNGCNRQYAIRVLEARSLEEIQSYTDENYHENSTFITYPESIQINGLEATELAIAAMGGDHFIEFIGEEFNVQFVYPNYTVKDMPTVAEIVESFEWLW